MVNCGLRAHFDGVRQTEDPSTCRGYTMAKLLVIFGSAEIAALAKSISRVIR